MHMRECAESSWGHRGHEASIRSSDPEWPLDV